MLSVVRIIEVQYLSKSTSIWEFFYLLPMYIHIWSFTVDVLVSGYHRLSIACLYSLLLIYNALHCWPIHCSLTSDNNAATEQLAETVPVKPEAHQRIDTI